MSEAAQTSAFVEGQELDGFIVKKVTPLENQEAVAIELLHPSSGARLMKISNEDEENLFSVAFRTPPDDDTGLPHILEHSVLCGSKKYPVKHPFIEMVKMSMATFINAMTGSDITLYPVASNVKKDFYNLAEVYWDAAFHPKLSEETFKQEGHHLEFSKKNDPSSDLIVKGIVYNEMKGGYSSPEYRIRFFSEKALFPDTPYGLSSGGDPDSMPELTFSHFKGFYDRLYHPSNAYIFLYGNIPLEEQLSFLSPRLDSYTAQDPQSAIPRQPRFEQSKSVSESYPIGPNEKPDSKTFLNLAWLVGDGTDVREVLAFSILDHLLLGTSAAPLKKALVDSRLGEDVSMCGFSGYGFESTFRVGLKGSEADRQGDFERLVMDVLSEWADKPFPDDRVQAGFHQMAYPFLEISSMFPLHTCFKTYASWLHDADPLDYLRAEEHIAALKKDYQADPMIFSKLIRERLLDNPHRVSIVLTPDSGWQARKDAEFAEKMADLKKSLTEEERSSLVKEADELEQLQNTPNTPEALATLPQLTVSDLPSKPKHIPTTVEELGGGIDVLRNDVFANGVNYFHLAINLEGLDPELYPYLPLYASCVQKMGAAGMDYAQMAERVAACTGGVGFGTECGSHAVDPDLLMRRARFSFKTQDDKIDDALSVVRDKLFELDFSDDKRFREVLVQEKASYRSRIAHMGRELATRHAARGINAVGNVNELLSGLPQVRLIQKLADEYDQCRDATVSKLERIRGFLHQRERLTASFTGTASVYDKVTKTLSDWAGQMRTAGITDNALPFKSWNEPRREGLAAPMQVAYCALMLPAPHLSHPDAAPLTVGSLLLSRGYMWEEIRIKGGAYGAGTGWNGLGGTWSFWSYRDPWIKKTLDAYRAMQEHVRGAEWSRVDIDRAIIGTAKQGEKPIRPGGATGSALWRHLHGDTPERREERHAAVLSVAPQDVKRAILEVLGENIGKGAVCVVSNREKLERANEELADAPLSIEDIMS